MGKHVAVNYPVRVIDAMIESFDLQAFSHTDWVLDQTERSAYRPAVLAELPLSGFCNLILSCSIPERGIDFHPKRAPLAIQLCTTSGH